MLLIYYSKSNQIVDPSILGCTDSTALNYDPLANTDDGSCIYPIYGCTDSTALNYNPLANTDDSTCCFLSQNWNQIGQDIDGEGNDAESATSISLSNDGSIVAFGNRKNDGTGSNNSGFVRIYNYNDTSWIQLGQDIVGEAAGDYSGSSVSLSGDGSIVAIGAPNNDGNGNESGHVRIYSWDGSSWNQLGQDIDGEAADDQSGRYGLSISSDGNTVDIGAAQNDGNGTNSGHVRIYNFDGSSWNLEMGAAFKLDDLGRCDLYKFVPILFFA